MTLDDEIVRYLGLSFDTEGGRHRCAICSAEEAEQTLDLVDINDRNGASDRVRKARIDARKARLRLTKAMA